MFILGTVCLPQYQVKLLPIMLNAPHKFYPVKILSVGYAWFWRESFNSMNSLN